jgi:hybrid cluster-associated redox disulfide protein
VIAMLAVTPDTTIDELLTAYPAAARAFVNHGMACVGCTMARFDTVGQAAIEYGLDIAPFVSEIAHLCDRGLPGNRTPADYGPQATGRAG